MALALSFHNFERAMGVAVRPDRLAVGTLARSGFCARAGHCPPARARGPARCVLSRPVGAHDRRHPCARDDLGRRELWLVNTKFSCLCTLDESHSFVPRWRPPYITALAAEDRCHLNGLAWFDGRPKYVTAMAETDTPQGWRPNKATTGCLIDVPSGQTVARGFAMPHSPRVHQGRVWLLDSGTGRLVTVDPATGQVTAVAEQPGYTRGLAMHGSYAFIGASKIRETSTFGGVPIAERRESLHCGVGVVELTTGRPVAHLEFKSGVDEIFDVQVLPGVRLPAVSGPYPEKDGAQTIWTVPDPAAQSDGAICK